jgi:hypothetical protein
VCAVRFCVLHPWLTFEDTSSMHSRGSTSVSFKLSEYCPVSIAYLLFTSLGLRHLVILGGTMGGEVVGVLTRENLLPAYIEARTGI